MMCLSNNVKERLFDSKLYLESLENHSKGPTTDYCDYIELSDCKDIAVGNNDLSVLELNVRGLVNKQTEIYMMLKLLTQMSSIDIVILVETWLTKESESCISLPSYSYVGKPRLHKKGGGVGFLIRDNISYVKCSNLSVESETLENCFIELTNCKRNIIIGSMYRPPNTSEKNFLYNMKQIMTTLNKKDSNKELIVGMDHNLDLLKHNLHCHTQSFMELLIENNCLPTVTRPTQVTNTSATLLDNIILSVNLTPSSPVVL